MRVWTWAMKRGGPLAEFSIFDDGLEIAVCYTSEDAMRITDVCNAAEQRMGREGRCGSCYKDDHEDCDGWIEFECQCSCPAASAERQQTVRPSQR